MRIHPITMIFLGFAGFFGWLGIRTDVATKYPNFPINLFDRGSFWFGFVSVLVVVAIRQLKKDEEG